MRAFRRKAFESAEALAEESGMPLARARQLWPLLTRGDLSLDASMNDSPGAIDRMSYKQPTPEETVARSQSVHHVREALESAMQSLTVREQRIVEARILSDEPQTLESLGQEMGVSKERVRQLEVRARQKLRNRLEHLRPAA
jgi:RNA polymerase sigma-32 factor